MNYENPVLRALNTSEIKKKSKVLFYLLLSDFRNQIDLEGHQVSPACPSGKSNLQIKMGNGALVE